MMEVFALLIALLSFSKAISSETASFYGSSYISVPLLEGKNVTDISFKIMTKKSDALLLLAAGQTDYCLMKLVSGRLKVYINLGAGESTIASPHGLRLDDLNWHHISFTRKDADVTLTIDNIHVTREKLMGDFFLLNIHYGLFIGGQGEFSELFLGHGDWLRGCLSDLVYNGVYPLQLARKRLEHSQIHDISWSCAAEFVANASSEISFIDDGSFLLLPSSIPRTGARWELEIKTTSTDGVILYTSGGGENSDFVGVEIVGGKVRMILDKGGGPAEVTNDIYVSDGKWHKLVINFNPNIAQVIVDNKPTKQKLTLSATRFFDLGDVIFIGGVELNKRARALGQGLQTADTSMKGCIRNIHKSTQLIGLPDAKITQGLLANCVWSYPCNDNPCKEHASCVPRGVNSFMCLCSDKHCVKQEFPNGYTVYSKTLQLELLELNPIVMQEGENIVITPEHINIVLDYAKYGVRDSGVLFSTVPNHYPKHGHLVIEVWQKFGTPQTFTLLDLIRDKVMYVHDGSENFEDNIHLDLELSPGTGYVLPSYLQGQHRFILHVNITSVNDAPVISILPTKTLKIPAGTRKLLLPSVLNATDPDSPRNKLIYTIINDGSGRLERINQHGVAITSFTQEDLDANMIAYFTEGPTNSNSKLIFKVSDGYSTTTSDPLKITVIPLVVQVLNNTGVYIPYSSSVIITSKNLTVVTNAEDPMLEITFTIVKDCEFGVIEKEDNLAGGESWHTVSKFTNVHLEQEIIRYRHTKGKPSQDSFKFTLSGSGTDIPTQYEFEITFIELSLENHLQSPLMMNGTVEGNITIENLSYKTYPIETNPKYIVYTLNKLPQFGNLRSAKHNERLVMGDNFTQLDINYNYIKYKMFRTSYSSFTDVMGFTVSTYLCPMSLTGKMNFIYSPPSKLPLSMKSTLNVLKVMEGGTVPILPSEINITVANVKSLVYEVYYGPLHGRLFLVDLMQNSTEDNVVHFTPSQINAGRLFYSHDGSESPHDTIKFVAVSNVEDDVMIFSELDINITLVNDNAPVRVVSSVFRIVKGGQRLLTTKHIKFSDEDIDFNVNNLVYTVKNGSGVYSSITHTKIQQFTQGDLEEEKVLIIESELSENPLLFSISDGTHATECYLDIRPSPPYVEITNNSHLVVSQGGHATVTTSNLFADTNIDIRLQDIRYYIVSGPTHGEILISGVSNKSKFHQQDIEAGNVIYKHLSSSVAQDRIQLKITVQDIYTEGTLAVRVFPAIYWEPLIVISNETVHVEEYTGVVVKRENLQIHQPGIPPSDITFLVVSTPKRGYLEIEGNDEEKGGEFDEKGGIRAFDQATVNAGKLYYVQSAANVSEDTIVVDVTNGVSWLRSLIIKFLIIPSKFYLKNSRLTVMEGGSVKLPHSLFCTTAQYYKDKITDYQLQTHPNHGRIIMSPSNKGVSKWTNHQTKINTIMYVHDGSETLQDSFSIVGKVGSKVSEPAFVEISVTPINDMIPTILNKTNIKIWKGGSEIITSEYLAVTDKDTDPENIIFVIISASGGHVAQLDGLQSVDKFTQKEINTKKIVLVHDGGQGNLDLDFVVTDGKNKLGPISYTAETAKAVLELVLNKGLHVFPLLQKEISSLILQSSCSDNREIIYKIKKNPKFGHLFLRKDKGRRINNFTQSDINSMNVLYEHTVPFKESSVQDFFVFDVIAKFVDPLKDMTFKIEVSVFSGGLDQYFDFSSSTLTIEEGGSAFIHLNTSLIQEFLVNNISLVDPNLIAVLILQPQNGVICFNDICNITTFSQLFIDSGNILYQHDHSDTLSDSFMFSLYLEPGDVLLLNISFVVEVEPINDQPFNLITTEPHINVVQGQKKVITKDDLYTEDLDTDANEIIYEIVSGPNLGVVQLNNNTTVTFSQENVNNGEVFFKHSGPLQATSFYFRVSDGKFTPVYTVFHVTVLKIYLNITVLQPVLLQQGKTVANISKNILSLHTNANKQDIIFNVLTSPKRGLIHVNGTHSSSFSYNDLLNKNVSYIQENLTAPSDSFELMAYNTLNLDFVIKGLWINISVIPLLIMGNFSPLSGTKTKLDLSTLDATPLAKLTNSNPVYKILMKPKYGHLKKIIRTTGEYKIAREKDVMKFTHEEIQIGLIYYVSKPTIETVEDKIPFLIYGSMFQPAVGELRFEIIGDSPSTTFKPPKPRWPGAKPSVEQDSVQIASPNMSDDYLLGVSLVTGIIALALLIVGFVRCGSKHTNFEDSIKSDLPEPLPHPPDNLLPTSPQIAMSGTPILTPANLPQCKVTSNSLNSSEPELNLRYPYGDEDWSNFNDSRRESKSNNLILRKNQYWV
ncbi:chondroitin sulfate proteoglycan 4 [Cimex lectularius]|uniref:Chondroitin sulfate proteoglycan 4 n=1 Tax=Cimex lectularius TaxID=79782 RepID=A0A8I6RQ77_CIMLE|nr:chondroitin sulfate proteoglycan 4 [Cimex lectularius]